MKKINIALSSSSIDNAIKELRKYQSSLDYKCQLLAEGLAQEGIYIARVKISEHDAIYTTELLQSIKSEYGGVIEHGGKWLVYTDCEYAPYVEFGTGIVGSQNPHPNTALANWRYDVNEHGEKGWSYFNEQDGQWHWTKGMESRPFMYETGQELRKKVQKIAKEVFRE